MTAIETEPGTKFSVQMGYPAPTFADLDNLLDQLATDSGGSWFGSGIGLVNRIGERDIEFHFVTQFAAQAFARNCSFIVGVRLISLERIE